MPKKKIIFYALLTFSVFILIYLGTLSVKNFKNKSASTDALKNTFDINTISPFSINKIVYFSSANANSKINPNSSFTILDLFQYTDIAIFINNNNLDENFSAKNTLKTLNLSNIEFSLSPTIGTPNLYFKDLNKFAVAEFDQNKKIENNLNFEISSKDEINYSEPILYNNCANPITLSYVNTGIRSDYTLTDNISHISYDGSLIKRCGVTLNSISCKISFVINITNNLDEHFSCPIIIHVPLSTESSTIYDGNLILNSSVDYKFLQMK